jgi:hypothetical protein
MKSQKIRDPDRNDRQPPRIFWDRSSSLSRGNWKWLARGRWLLQLVLAAPSRACPCRPQIIIPSPKRAVQIGAADGPPRTAAGPHRFVDDSAVTFGLG